MSGRTLPRAGTAGLLILALASSPLPVLGESPHPWRGQTVEIAPAPRVKAVKDGLDVRLTWTYIGPPILAAPQPAPPVAPAVMPAPVFQYQPAPAIRQHATADPVPPPGPAVAVITPVWHHRPLGTWYRELPGAVVSASFTPDGNGLTAKITLNNNGDLITITLTGDCAVTADGTVHGVVTGADVTAGSEQTSAGMELAGLSAGLQLYVDQPFAFRCRAADGGLMVSNLRVSGSDGEMMRESLSLVAGKYRVAGNGPVPTPKPVKLTPASSGPSDVGLNPVAVPSGVPTCLTANLPPASPVMAGPNSACSAPPEVFGMMAGTFGQMVGVPQSGPGMAAPCPAQSPGSPVHAPLPTPSSVPSVPTSSYPPQAVDPVPCPATVGQVVGPVPTLVPSQSPAATAGYVAPAATPATAPVMRQGQLPIRTWVCDLGLSTDVPHSSQSPPVNALAVSPMAPPEPLPSQSTETRAACPQSTFAAAQPGKLSLADVVTLTRVHASDDVIVNQIRNTGSTFVLTVTDIQFLKMGGVSDSVIIEMQKASILPNESGLPQGICASPPVIAAPPPATFILPGYSRR